MSELSERAKALYDQCKDAPETTPGGMIRLIELRNLVPDLIDRIDQLEAERAEWLEPPRPIPGRQPKR